MSLIDNAETTDTMSSVPNRLVSTFTETRATRDLMDFTHVISSANQSHDKILDYERLLVDSPTTVPKELSFSVDEKLFATKKKGETLESILDELQTLHARRSTLPGRAFGRRSSTLGPKKFARELRPLQRMNTVIIEHPQNMEFENRDHHKKLTWLTITKQHADEKDHLKSVLTSHLDKIKLKKDHGANPFAGGKKRGWKKFKVYFFGTEINLDMLINPAFTVADVIKQIIERYMDEETMNKALMEYPKKVEAYELRMIDDDDKGFKPDMSIPAFEKNRVFNSLNLQDTIAFLRNSHYVPDDSKNMDDTLRGHVYGKDKKILVKIMEGKNAHMLGLPQDGTVHDIFQLMQRKGLRINEKIHCLVVRSDENRYPLIDGLPLKSFLKKGDPTLDLDLVKKKYGDDSTIDLPPLRTRLFGDATEETIINDPESGEGYEVLYNPVTASLFEEFRVIKPNYTGKHKVRYLGISSDKMYTLYHSLYSQKESNAEQGGLKI